MGKRTYRAIVVKAVEVERLAKRFAELAIFGVDAAKDGWFGVFMTPEGEVVLTVKWDLVAGTLDLIGLLEAIRANGVDIEAAVEPTGTYAEAFAYQLQQSGFSVFQVSPKHSHDYAEIYDGVPSSHDAKSAAIVADLHRTRRSSGRSREWPRPSEERRGLRARANEVDWVKADQLRYGNRLEALLAMHWPEAGRIVDHMSKSFVSLVAAYGDPSGVAADPEGARTLLEQASRGKLPEEKIEALLESARQTLGCPTIPDETHELKTLGAKLLEFRTTLKAAEARLETRARGDAVVVRMAPVVGLITAAVLTARLGHLTEYDSVGATLRGGGLNLKTRSSGKHKGKLKITKRGSAVARRWLYLAVLRWIQKDPIAKAWYQRKLAHNGGEKVKAQVALMRKLLAGLYHVARGAEFDSKKLFDVQRLGLGELSMAS